MTAVRLILFVCALILGANAGSAQPLLPRMLAEVPAAELVPGAESYGVPHGEIAAAPVLKGGQTIAWAFVTSDFVSTTGYSGKPIHTLVAVDADARVVGVKLVKHSEPIVLIGIPEARMQASVATYLGLDLVAEAKSGGTSHDIDIISGATVTVMVIDDSSCAPA